MAFQNGVNGRLLNALGSSPQGGFGVVPQPMGVNQPQPLVQTGGMGNVQNINQPAVSPRVETPSPASLDQFSNPSYPPPQPDIQVDPPQYQMPRDPLVKQPSPWAGAGVNTPFARAWPGVSQPRQPRAWPQPSGTPQWGGGQTRFRPFGR